MYSSIGRSTCRSAPPDGGKPPPRAMFGAIGRFVAGKTVTPCAGLDSKAQVDAAHPWATCPEDGRGGVGVGDFGE